MKRVAPGRAETRVSVCSLLLLARCSPNVSEALEHTHHDERVDTDGLPSGGASAFLPQGRRSVCRLGLHPRVPLATSSPRLVPRLSVSVFPAAAGEVSQNVSEAAHSAPLFPPAACQLSWRLTPVVCVCVLRVCPSRPTQQNTEYGGPPLNRLCSAAACVCVHVRVCCARCPLRVSRCSAMSVVARPVSPWLSVCVLCSLKHRVHAVVWPVWTRRCLDATPCLCFGHMAHTRTQNPDTMRTHTS